MKNFLRTFSAALVASLMAFSAPALAGTAYSPLWGPVTEKRDAMMEQVNARVEAMKNIVATCRTGLYGVAVLTKDDGIQAFIVTTTGAHIKFMWNAEMATGLAQQEQMSVTAYFNKACDEGALHNWADMAEGVANIANN